MRCVCHEGSKRALHHTHGLVGCLSRGGQPLVTQHCHSGGRDVPASQYLALHWLSSPLIHHPALDLKERNGINHPAGHTARLPSPFAGPCGSQALRGLYQECFLVESLCLMEGGLRCTWKRKGSCASPTGTGGSPRDPQEPPQLMMKKTTLLKDDLGQQHLAMTTPASHLWSHTLPWFSDTWLDKCIGRVYNQKWLCLQSDFHVCLYLTSLSWFGHLGSLRKPSWKKPPCSCWHNPSPSLGFICKLPLCRTKLSNDICCLRGQSWTRSIKTNVLLSVDWENCSEAFWRTSYFALERFLWRLNTQQYLILSKIAVYCLFN